MSLPAETKFPCSIEPQDRSFTVEFDFPAQALLLCVYDFGVNAYSHMERAQVESLRDQLTDWLERAGK